MAAVVVGGGGGGGSGLTAATEAPIRVGCVRASCGGGVCAGEEGVVAA